MPRCARLSTPPVWVALLGLLACVPPSSEDKDLDSAAEISDEPLQRTLGACDLWDVPTLYGLEDLQPADRDAENVADLGLGWARAHRFQGHVFAQNIVSPPGEARDWTLPDHVVRTAGEQGIALLVTLSPLTEVSDSSSTLPFPRVSESAMPQWRSFVREMVERYDGDGIDDMEGLLVPVDAWEVGNEPSCRGREPDCMVGYLDLVLQTREAALEADPSAQVLVGGPAPVLQPSGAPDTEILDFYQYLYENDEGVLDGPLGFHVRTGDASLELVDYIDTWRTVLPNDLPLWITETGVRDPGGGTVAEDGEDQAVWLRDHIREAFALGVERVMVCKVKVDLDRPPAVGAMISQLASEL